MSTLTDEVQSRTSSAEAAPDLHCERTDSAGQILRLLSLLPESQQTVIRLRFQNGLSYREISTTTGLTVNHVGVLLHTGLKTLRERLQPAVPTG